MDDRTLLERAAKAAGIDLVIMSRRFKDDFVELWNPLTDDGDALRLAVQLNMHLHIDFDRPERRDVRAYVDGADAREVDGDDPYAATRRGIVRAAAALAPE